ncbi:MAG: hypothetical protein ACT4NY_04005 [Pseudonocardiales bacterium]
MISRKLAGASAAGAGAATAVAALLLGTVSSSAADVPTSSAYGIVVQGLVPIDPTPQVQAPPDGADALAEFPSPLGVGLLKVIAAGSTSSATAVDLNIADLVKAEVIKATCNDGVGDVSILGGDIGGSALPSDPGVGEGLDLSPIANVVFNHQSDNDDGSLTVEGVRISVLPGGQVPDLAITPANLEQLKDLAPNLNVPTVEQLQAEAQAEQPPAEQAPAEQPPAEQAPAEELAEPTLDDLLAQLAELNSGLELPIAEGDALLEIVISSATCGAEKAVTPSEAPKPKPVQTQLPVTH